MTMAMMLKTEGRPCGDRGHAYVFSLTAVLTCLQCGAGYLEQADHDCYTLDEPTDWLS